MIDINEKLAYNVSGAAKYLNCSKTTIYMLNKNKLIISIKMGRNYIFSKSELDNFNKKAKDDREFLSKVNEVIRQNG